MARCNGSPRRNADHEISNLKFEISNLPMTLGRTASNAIKIKTDTAGGGLRAVECACCSSCNCNPPLTVKYKFTDTFSQIIGEQSWTSCGSLVATTASGHSISASRRCTDGAVPDWFDGWEIQALGGGTFECGNLVTFVFGPSPVGTHTLFGNYCNPGDPCPCEGWTLTIGEDIE